MALHTLKDSVSPVLSLGHIVRCDLLCPSNLPGCYTLAAKVLADLWGPKYNPVAISCIQISHSTLSTLTPVVQHALGILQG